MKTVKILLVLLSIAFSLASCKRAQKEDAPAEPPRVITLSDSPPNAFPFTKGEDPAKDIVGSIMRLKTVPFWTSETFNSNSPKTKVVMRFVSPNRYHMSGPEGDIMSIAGESWIKTKEGWQKSDFPFGDLGGINPNLSMTDFNAKASPTYVARGTFEGSDVSIYTYRDDATVNTMWIDSESGLLIKTIAESTVKGNKFSRTTTYDYKTPVSIEPPQDSSK